MRAREKANKGSQKCFEPKGNEEMYLLRTLNECRIVYSGTALKRGNAGEKALGTARGEAKETHCVHNDEHHSDSEDKRHF